MSCHMAPSQLPVRAVNLPDASIDYCRQVMCASILECHGNVLQVSQLNVGV